MNDLAFAVAMKQRILCKCPNGQLRYYLPRRDKDGNVYVKIGRAPGVRYEVDGFERICGEARYLLTYIPA